MGPTIAVVILVVFVVGLFIVTTESAYDHQDDWKKREPASSAPDRSES